MSGTMSYEDDECFACLQYIRPKQDASEWECTICGIKEQGTEDIQHPRYELACGHAAHPRCFRKWCKLHGSECVKCPRPLSEADVYCMWCDEYGHSPKKHQ